MKKTIFSKICLITTMLCLMLSFIACDNTSSSTSSKESISTSTSTSISETASASTSTSIGEKDSTPASEGLNSSESSTESESESASEPLTAASLVSVVDNMVIITVNSAYMEITAGTVLIDYMAKLKADGAIDYTVSNDGMINSINGQANPADWSKCWMLYSNDAELSNEAWGFITLNGVKYLSAIFGAESLPIKDGKIYVWEFKSF